MDFLELAKKRYSERYFDQRPIEQEKLDKILEAGRIIPTACNYQPQHFYIIRSEDGLRKLKTVTHFHYNVPLMICALCGEIPLTDTIRTTIPVNRTLLSQRQQ